MNVKRIVGLAVETFFAALLVSPFVVLAGATAPVATPEPQQAPSAVLIEATSTVPTTTAPTAATTTTAAPTPLPMPTWGEPELVPATAGQEPLQDQREVIGREPLQEEITEEVSTCEN